MSEVLFGAAQPKEKKLLLLLKKTLSPVNHVLNQISSFHPQREMWGQYDPIELIALSSSS